MTFQRHVTAHFVYVLGCSSYAKTEMFNNCTKNQGAWCNDACYYGENKTLVQNCTQIEPISPSDDYFQYVLLVWIYFTTLQGVKLSIYCELVDQNS